MAWGVHSFTACGAICGFLSLQATYARHWREALLWLVVGIVIDACDGTFARLLRVKQVLPNFDGELLDNLIDYLNYVFVPAVILHVANLLPKDISIPAAVAVCLASAYQFCQRDAKTTDHFFLGFPSYWNVLVLYLLALHLSPLVNLAIVVLLIVLVFVPVKYIYVNRTRPFQKLTLTLTVIWAATMLRILWHLPDPNQTLVIGSLLYVAYYACLSLYLTARAKLSPTA